MTTKIVLENNRAVGVEYDLGNQLKRARARKGVILAGGAFNTPQLLNLSGIGNADDLQKLGIPVKVHLPGVGYNLQDHLDVSFQQVCTSVIQLSDKKRTRQSRKVIWDMINILSSEPSFVAFT